MGKKQQPQKATAQVATQFVRDLGGNILVSSGPTRERERERELGYLRGIFAATLKGCTVFQGVFPQRFVVLL